MEPANGMKYHPWLLIQILNETERPFQYTKKQYLSEKRKNWSKSFRKYKFQTSTNKLWIKWTLYILKIVVLSWLPFKIFSDCFRRTWLHLTLSSVIWLSCLPRWKLFFVFYWNSVFRYRKRPGTFNSSNILDKGYWLINTIVNMKLFKDLLKYIFRYIEIYSHSILFIKYNFQTSQLYYTRIQIKMMTLFSIYK